MIAVTGNAGFVGRNLTDALDSADVKWRGFEENEEFDFDGCDTVVHLAANADVRFGWDDPWRDLTRGTFLTQMVLEAMRAQGVRRLIYASSSSVYGHAPIPTKETYFGKQTSLYGASKLACEGLIGAYHEAGHINATTFRFTSMLGRYYKHGLVADFVEQIQKENRVTVLGGGAVPRTRMHVLDAVAAVTQAVDRDFRFDVYNVSRPDMITSLEVAQIVGDHLGTEPVIGTVDGSWKGDHPILLDATKLRRETGWVPERSIRQGIRHTVDWLTT